jgi:hypothetical protein
MSPHFRAYAHNLTRMSIIETIDAEAAQRRLLRARPSLIANPLTGRPYSQPLLTSCNDASATRAQDGIFSRNLGPIVPFAPDCPITDDPRLPARPIATAYVGRRRGRAFDPAAHDQYALLVFSSDIGVLKRMYASRKMLQFSM